MRIAQIAPLYESVPPKLYGGTERVVSYLTEELVRQGHEVTLFASEDSRTHAHLNPLHMPALRLSAAGASDVAAHYRLLEDVMRHGDEFEAMHFHVDFLHFPFTRRAYPKHLTTLHGRLDMPGLTELYEEYWDQPVVSISASQKAPLPHALWIGTVYHGLPLDLYRPGPGKGGYLAFLGRIAPEKGPEEAIAIAKAAGIPLKIAAKVDPVDQDYFEARVKPLLDSNLVQFIGEVDEAGKQDLLGDALALVFPIDWPEPFGLVMIEAMACGTPVVAYRRGSVPEIIDEGLTGFIVEDRAGAVDVLSRVGGLDRAAIRQRFEARFGVERMVRDYLDIYRVVARFEDDAPHRAVDAARRHASAP